MPPVVLAVAAYFAVSTAMATFIIVSAVVTLASVAYSAYMMASMEKPKQADAVSRQQTVRSSVQPHRVIYGEVMTGGVLVYAQSHSVDPITGVESDQVNKYISLVVAFAGHEVDEIKEVWLNDKLSTDVAFIKHVPYKPAEGYYGFESSEEGAPLVFIETRPAVAAHDESYLNVTKYTGTPDQEADPFLLTLPPKPTNVISRFPESGLNNLTVYANDEDDYYGTYSGVGMCVFSIRVTATNVSGDTFHWVQTKYIGDGTVEETASGDAVMTGSAQVLADGVAIAFVVPTGHSIGQTWEVRAFDGAPWTADCRLRGRAYVVVTMEKNDTAFPNGLPNIRALIRGNNQIYDPTGGSIIETQFARNTPAYKLDGSQVTSGVPRYETGKYGQAIMLEEGTTNLLTRSNMDTLTDWSASNGGTHSLETVSPGGAFPAGATACIKTVSAVGSPCYEWQAKTLLLSTVYTLQAWVYIPSSVLAGHARFQIFYDNAGWNGLTGGGLTITERDQWVFKTLTFTSHATYATHIIGVGGTGLAATQETMYRCKMQLEQKAYATSYMATTTTSASRTIEGCTLPAGLLSNTEGAVACWVKPDNIVVGRHHGILHNGSFGATGFYFWITSTTLQCIIGNGTTGVACNVPNLTNGEHHVAVTYTPTTVVIYVDGVGTTFTGTFAPTFPGVLALGGNAVADRMLNGLMDDLRIYNNRAPSASEIYSLYAATSPRPVAPDVYQLTFNGLLQGSVGYSNNWALCVRDYLTKPYGLNSPAEDINDTIAVAAKNLSDELVTLADGTTQARYTLNGSFTLDKTPTAIMNEMLAAAYGAITWTQGQYRILPAAYYAPDMTFHGMNPDVPGLTESDLRGAIKVRPLPSMKDRFNTVKGTYISPETWQPVDFPKVGNALYLSEDNDIELIKDIQLTYVTDPVRAQRIAKIMLEKNRQGIIVEFPAKWSAFPLAVGDNVPITVANLGWSQKIFTVRDWKMNTNGGIDLTLQEDAVGCYSWNSGEETTVDLAPNTLLPDPRDVATPLSLAAGIRSYNTNADTVSRVDIYATWEQGDARAVRYQVQYQDVSGAWFSLPDTIDTVAVISGLNQGAYNIRVRSINAIGAPSEWTSVSQNVPLPTNLTADVTGFAATFAANIVNLSWNLNDALSIASYEIRQGAVWETASVVRTGEKSARYNFRPTGQGAITYLIKAVDSVGNYSENAASANVTIPAAAAPTAIVGTGVLFGIDLLVTYANTLDIDYCEIWAATTNNRASAVQIGITRNGKFAHEGLGNAATRYYWARTMNVFQENSAWYPVSATAGVSASTIASPSDVIKLLNNQVDNTALTAYLAGVGSFSDLVDTFTPAALAGVGGAGVFATKGQMLIAADKQIQLKAGDADVSAQIDILDTAIGLKLNKTGTVGAGMLISEQVDGSSLIQLWSDKLQVCMPDGTGVKAFLTTGTIGGTPTVGISGDMVLDGAFTARMVGTNELIANTANIANGIITAANIANATITDAQIANATITSAKIASLSATLVNAVAINANSITAGTLTGRTLQTASSGQRFVVDVSTNNGQFYDSGGTLRLSLGGYTSANGYSHFYVNANTALGHKSIELHGKADLRNGLTLYSGGQYNNLALFTEAASADILLTCATQLISTVAFPLSGAIKCTKDPSTNDEDVWFYGTKGGTTKWWKISMT